MTQDICDFGEQPLPPEANAARCHRGVTWAPLPSQGWASPAASPAVFRGKLGKSGKRLRVGAAQARRTLSLPGWGRRMQFGMGDTRQGRETKEARNESGIPESESCNALGARRSILEQERAPLVWLFLVPIV